MAAKAWGGRFREETDPRVEKFTESISFDARLAQVDLRGSKAHAQMLSEVGLLTTEEFKKIAKTLDEIGTEFAEGKIELSVSREDIHMHIEHELIERLGDIGRKIHTGRSRNDQISTDLKLYTRDAVHRLDGLLKNLQESFVRRSETEMEVIIPGFTHLQRAQPVMLPHVWFSYCEKFQRDRERLQDSLKRINVSPLGTAALAGTSLPIDRHRTAELLGFDALAANSLDVSSDRDYLLEFVFDLSTIAIHLSTLAEEWIIWSSTEFQFLQLPDAYTTGSSLMPQKRNPDVLELIRGKSARVIASVMQLSLLLKGLPQAYNRDLQEDKIAVFDAYDTVVACLELAPEIVAGAVVNREIIEERLEEGFLDATVLVEYLIGKGIPMRRGHEIVGELVSLCETTGCRLEDLSHGELQDACEEIDDDVFLVLGASNAADSLKSYGSGGPDSVKLQLETWQKRLELR